MKKYLLIALKIMVTVGVFTWVIHTNKLDDIWRNLCAAQPFWLALALLIFASAMGCGICRWQILLRVQGIRLSAYQVSWITATGMFFNAFLLGATGGDVFKAWYAASAAPSKKTEAILSIVVDRVIGLIGLFLLATIAILINLPAMLEHEKTKWLVYLVLAGLIVPLVLFGLGTQRHHLTSSAWWNRLWHYVPFKNIFRQLSESYRLYEKHPYALISGLLLSLGVHLFSLLSAWAVGQALRVEGARLVHYFLYCPLINALAAAPISISGLGLREFGFNYFFPLQGVPGFKAIALSLMFYAVNLTLCLLCGIWFLVGKRGTRVAGNVN